MLLSPFLEILDNEMVNITQRLPTCTFLFITMIFSNKYIYATSNDTIELSIFHDSLTP